jgi:hypothetical protein
MQILLTIIIFFGLNIAYSQTPPSSKHTISYFINGTQQKIASVRIRIFIGSDTIIGKQVANQYTFPIIGENKEFIIEVQVNRNKLLAGPFKGLFLNLGSQMTFGRLTNLSNLLSVAKYNFMDSTDKDWNIFSKRFFILGHSHTLDIVNIGKIKELQFLIIDPHCDGDCITLTTQKITKLR